MSVASRNIFDMLEDDVSEGVGVKAPAPAAAAAPTPAPAKKEVAKPAPAKEEKKPGRDGWMDGWMDRQKRNGSRDPYLIPKFYPC